jgi:hypothetical protein
MASVSRAAANCSRGSSEVFIPREPFPRLTRRRRRLLLLHHHHHHLLLLARLCPTPLITRGACKILLQPKRIVESTEWHESKTNQTLKNKVWHNRVLFFVLL